MINKRMISMTVATMIGISTLSCINVFAAESKAVKDAKAKISHLTWSLKNNYLGLKNQGTWEMYVKQARELIKKIPSSESSISKSLSDEVNRDADFIMGLARINHVEKSMTPKEQGGYGNALIPKNVPTWREYIRLANIDLAKVNLTEFKKQYDELIKRRDIVNNKLDEIMKGDSNNNEDEYTVKDYKANGYDIKRMYGTDSFTTASLLAREFKKISESGKLGILNDVKEVNTVILVDVKDKMAGALSAPLVKKYNAPIMYIDGDKLPSVTKTELTKSSFKNAVIVSSTLNPRNAVQDDLKGMSITVKEKFIEKNMYDLSFAIAKSIEKISEVNVVDGDTNTYFDRVVTLAPLSAYNEVTVLIPTKGIAPQDLNKFKNYEEWISKLNKEQGTGHQAYDKNLSYVVRTSLLGGYSSVFGGYSEIVGSNFAVNITINNVEDNDLKKTNLVMAHGNKTTDIVSIMPLAVKMRTSLLYGGDQPSITLPDPDARKIALKERYGSNINPTQHIYMVGDYNTLKNGVEKKLKGEDY